MRSLNRLGTASASLPLPADEVIEFHAARLLLLLNLCGTAGRIDGLTKMAKLDFFARYPEFFEIARSAVEAQKPRGDRDVEAVESAMIRHHYGPWDKRYYHVLANLEAKRLINVAKEKNYYRISLTQSGIERAKVLTSKLSYAPLVGRMREIKKTFGSRNGSYLKELIYRVFDTEVGRKPMGEVIDR